MPQVAVDDRYASPSTLSSALGVKGPLRVRSYGNVKHAHVVLRKVDQEEYEDTDGHKRTRVVFSLFAHKLINVKAGKELYLYVQTAAGELQECPVAFEGELPRDGDDDIQETFDTKLLKKEQELLQQQQAMPPKMRKLWAKKSESPAVVHPRNSFSLIAPVPEKVSKQTQTMQATSSVQVQAVPPQVSAATQTIIKRHVHTGCQVSSKLLDSSVQTLAPQPPPRREDSGIQTLTPAPVPRREDNGIQTLSIRADSRDVPIQTSLLASAVGTTDSRRKGPGHGFAHRADALRKTVREGSHPRSLSPMELESPTSTPRQSPVVGTPMMHEHDALLSPMSLSTTPQPEPHGAAVNATSRSSSASLDTDIRSSRTASPTVTDVRVPVTSSLTNGIAVTNIEPESSSSAILTGSSGKLPTTVKVNASLPPRPPAVAASKKRAASPPRAPAAWKTMTASAPRAPAALIATATAPPRAPAALTATTAASIVKPKSVKNLFVSGGFISSSLSETVAGGSAVKQTRQVEASPSKLVPLVNAIASSSKTSDGGSSAVPSPSLDIPGPNRADWDSTTPSLPPFSLSASNAAPRGGGRPPAPRLLINALGSTPTRATPDTRSASRLLTPPPSNGNIIFGGKPFEGSDGVSAGVGTAENTYPQSVAIGVSTSFICVSPLTRVKTPPSQVKEEPQSPIISPLTGWLPVGEPIAKTKGPRRKRARQSSANTSQACDPIYIQDSDDAAAQSPLLSRKASDSKSLNGDPSTHHGGRNGHAELSSSRSRLNGFDSLPMKAQDSSTASGSEKSARPRKRRLVGDSYRPGADDVYNNWRPQMDDGGDDRRRADDGHDSWRPQDDGYNSYRPLGDSYRPRYSPDRSRYSPNSVDSPRSTTTTKHSDVWVKRHVAQINFDNGTGVRAISFNPSGAQFAVICYDHTIRIWNTAARCEIAKLAHNAAVVSLSWMQGDMGLVSLGLNGVVNKWTLVGQNQWHWAKVLDAGDADPACMAYSQDRIAISYPRIGVKVWSNTKSHWQPQRTVIRQNVTALKFIEGGDVLVGGTTDGVLWRCRVPEGPIQASTFFKTKVFDVGVDSTGEHVVVAQAGGKAHIVLLGAEDQKGTILQAFSTREVEGPNERANHAFGAVFTSRDELVAFGSLGRRVLLWDRNEGSVKYELDHGSDVMIQAVASFDIGESDCCLITGNRQGKLTWWHPSSRLDDSYTDLPVKRRRSD